MALPFSLNNADPADVDSPGLGAQEFRDLKQTIMDMFGIPNNAPISGAIFSLGALTDGKIATPPVIKANNPAVRLIGTEGSALDVYMRERVGRMDFARNTGSEAVPVISRVFSFDMNASTNGGVFTHATTATRTWTFPDASGTVSLVGDVIPAATVMLFKQAAAPTGWTRIVDAGNTEAAIILRLNNEVPGTGGSWTITGLTTGDPSSGNVVPSFSGAGAIAVFPHNHVVTSDATWRPKYVDCILASKN